MSLIDDWGPEDEFPLQLKELSAEELRDLSFLFGGVGDGTSIISSFFLFLDPQHSR
jgi:hypothetical protein